MAKVKKDDLAYLRNYEIKDLLNMNFKDLANDYRTAKYFEIGDELNHCNMAARLHSLLTEIVIVRFCRGEIK
jgi:hypothetical protein